MRILNLIKPIWMLKSSSRNVFFHKKIHKKWFHQSFIKLTNEKDSKLTLKIETDSRSKEHKKTEEPKNDKQFNESKGFRKEKTPLQRLLRVKDYADWIFFLFLASGVYIWYKKEKEKKEVEKKFEVEWIKIPNFSYKLFTCCGFYLPEFIFKNLNNFKNFKTRKEDIWIISFPKSGLTFFNLYVSKIK